MKKSSYTILYIVIGALVVLFIAWSFFAASTTVAVVNGEKISRDYYIERLEAAAGYDTLNQIIGEVLIDQEAKNQGIVVDNAEVQSEFDKIKAQFGSSFSLILSQYGMSEEDLFKSIRINKIVMEISTKGLVIEEEDIEEYFNTNREYFDTPEMIRASHILVATQEEAEDLIARLKDGEDFADLAIKHSIDSGSYENGGDLGFFARGTMDTVFETAAFSANIDEIVGPVHNDYGYHIIKVTDKQAAKVATLEESREDVISSIKADKAVTSEEMMYDLAQRSKISVVDERFKSLESNSLTY